MRPDYRIAEAKRQHCGQILRHMRKAHRDALIETGNHVHAELAYVFDNSSFRRVCLLDGKPVALWGVTGTLASNMGCIWLILAEEATRFPRAIVCEGRKQLREIMQTFAEVATTTLGGDEAALRFALFLGFHADHTESATLSRKTLYKRLQTDPAVRIPIGKSYAVGMGYHLNTGHD